MLKSCSSVVGKHARRFPPGQLRTLQRRVKQWRSEIVCQLVLGLEITDGFGTRNVRRRRHQFRGGASMSNWLDFKSIKRAVKMESVLRHYT